MQNNFFLLLTVVTVYIGSVIGAGFASGQEIMQFFILHGEAGLYGGLLATLLFSYLGGLTMYLAVKYSTRSYGELVIKITGKKIFLVLFDLLNVVTLFGGLSVMMSGSGAVFREHLGLKEFYGAAAVCAITITVILGGLKRFLYVNMHLVPVKYLAVGAVAALALLFQSHDGASSFSLPGGGGVTGHWATAGVLYVSYNMISPFAVLATLGRHIPMKIGVAGGAAGGLLIGVAVILVSLAGLAFYPEVAKYEVPMIMLSGLLGKYARWVFTLVVWVAMLTTAIADAHALTSRLAPEGGYRYRFFGVLVCLLAILPASFNFSELVRVLYPLFGYAGLLLFVTLMAFPLIKIINIKQLPSKKL